MAGGALGVGLGVGVCCLLLAACCLLLAACCWFVAALSDRQVLIGQLLGAVVAVPSSRLSDHVGSKPAVYVSCVVQCVPCPQSPTRSRNINALVKMLRGPIFEVDFGMIDVSNSPMTQI